MANRFVSWLNRELAERVWDYATLARQSGLADATISNVINEKRKPGFEFCSKVARAFGMRDVYVLREAGLIEPLPPAVEEETAILNIVRGLPAHQRRSALAMLEGLARDTGERRQPRAPQPHAAPVRRHEPGQLQRLEAQFEAELAQLPPDASDDDVRAIAQRARERIWEIATPQQRQLLAQLYAAMAATLREERESESDCIPRSEPAC